MKRERTLEEQVKKQNYIQAQKVLKQFADNEKAKILRRFFKTGKGEYAEGDKFIGVTVPDTRKVAKLFAALELEDVNKLLQSKIHEERLLTLIILIDQFKKGDDSKRKKIFNYYLSNLKQINNWDLVDISSRDIVGAFLWDKSRMLLYEMAKSKNLWIRRIAIISTFYFIQRGEAKDTINLAKILISDQHDLIHKAVGWMLREVGKRINKKLLLNFLDNFHTKMPRTMLRYSMEHLPEKTRLKYLNNKNIIVN
ncbi:MAG: DNA alkylation repair protein [Oligoflexia bacterium]|nr:DNA alkylation repair protein [Oligoflexia bacterium]